MSAFFEATRDEYYRQLYNISSKGTWHDWFLYFLNGIAGQSLDVLSRAERINTLIINWQIKLDSSDGIAQNIVKYLAVNPYCTTKKIAENFKIAFTTAGRAIKKLEALGIVKQISHGKRDRVYCANEILSILEEPTRITENFDNTL